MKKVILASQSPRRQELLERVVSEFDCIPADIDETMDLTKDLGEEVKKVSYAKAMTILKQYPECIVIGSDTSVILDDAPLGKPKDKEEARRMLEGLQGRSHEVYTGLAVVSSKKSCVTLEKVKVTFSSMSKEEIEAYLNTEEWVDKAGGYGIQGMASRYIESIEGDYYSIMGLPVHKVYEALKDAQAY